MAWDLNAIHIQGRLVRDPEVRPSRGGEDFATFTLASNGKKDDPATFVDVTAFGKCGETIAHYCHKGDAIIVSGRLRQERWESNDGEKRSKLSVVADRVTLLGSRDRDDHADDDPPARRTPARSTPARSAPRPRVDEDGDDDVPF
jgi:single-strand DNA-binding protein